MDGSGQKKLLLVSGIHVLAGWLAVWMTIRLFRGVIRHSGSNMWNSDQSIALYIFILNHVNGWHVAGGAAVH